MPTIFQLTLTTSRPYENRFIHHEHRPLLPPRVSPSITRRALVFNRIKHMHHCRHCAWFIRPRISRSRFRAPRMPIRAFHGAKLHPIQSPFQNGAEKNPMKTDSITIGRDPVLTYKIMNGIAKREIKRRQREAKWMRIISTLKFWRK